MHSEQAMLGKRDNLCQAIAVKAKISLFSTSRPVNMGGETPLGKMCWA